MPDKRFQEIMEENNCTEECGYSEITNGECECYYQHSDEQPEPVIYEGPYLVK